MSTILFRHTHEVFNIYSKGYSFFSSANCLHVLSCPLLTANSHLLSTRHSALITFFPAYSLLFLEAASVWKTASSVGALRTASPQASNAGSEALLNNSIAHAGNAPKRRSNSLFRSFDSPSRRPSTRPLAIAILSTLAMYFTFLCSSIVSIACQICVSNHTGNVINQSMTLNKSMTRCLSQCRL